MNFALDESQSMLKDSVGKYLEKAYDFEARRSVVAAGGASEVHWSAFVEMGLLGAGLSEDEGGYGGGVVETAIVLEAFGKALVVEPFLAVGVLALQTLLGAGGDRAQTLVESVVAGEARVVLAHAEPAGRGDTAFVETAASPTTDGGYRLSGRKAIILGAPFATDLLISARTSGAPTDPDGISLFLVGPETPGVTSRPCRLADGSLAAEIDLDGVDVAGDALIGTAGAAFAALDRGHSHAIVGACAEAVGAMDRALWITRDYLQTRKQFGVPIGTFQALQHRMSDMLIELELSRSILYRAMAHIKEPSGLRAHAMAVAKVQIGKSAKFVGGQAIQLHGGIGVTEEYSIGHYFKRLTFLDNFLGSPQFHLRLIAEANQAA